MAEFNRIFTGENPGSGVDLYSKLGRSQERMDDLYLQAEELRLKNFKEAEKRFMDIGNIDMDSYLSTANAKTQADLLDKYNEKAQIKLKERGGRFENFTTQDWVDLQQGRKLLEAEQLRMKADMDRFKFDEQIIQRDSGRNYDPDEWNIAKREYLKNGRYTDAPLPIKEKPFESWLTGVSKDFTGEVETELDTSAIVDGKRQKRKTWANMTLPQAQEIIKQGVLLNAGERKNVLKRFESLPQEEQMKWLDVNGDGKVSSTERGNENGIIAWAQQYEPFIKSLIKEKSGTYSNVQTGSGSKGGISISLAGRDTEVGTGTPRSGSINYGGKDYGSLISLGGRTVVYDVPTDGGEKLSGSTALSLGKGNIRGQLVDYDPESNSVFVRLLASVDKLGLSSGQLVKIPSGNIIGIENHPVVVDGKQTTIGSLGGNKSTAEFKKKKLY